LLFTTSSYGNSLYRLKVSEDATHNTTIGKDIRALEHKISILDKIAFSSEQDCKRTEQRVQEIADKKYRLEKLIANILANDNEGYSKLKAIVNESVKAVLAENKK
jgi:hypothetical protein